VRNALSSTPVGLEAPAYRVVLKGDGFEVRDYEAYVLAATGMGAREDSPKGLYQGGTFTADSGTHVSEGFFFRGARAWCGVGEQRSTWQFGLELDLGARPFLFRRRPERRRGRLF
jgi:hypothetical protein